MTLKHLVQVSDTRSLHPIELHSIQYKFLVPVSGTKFLSVCRPRNFGKFGWLNTNLLTVHFCMCQVRFVHEIFRRLRPGVTVLALHSKMKYMKRLAMYESFVRKQYAVLFATDIAARGLGNDPCYFHYCFLSQCFVVNILQFCYIMSSEILIVVPG